MKLQKKENPDSKELKEAFDYIADEIQKMNKEEEQDGPEGN